MMTQSKRLSQNRASAGLLGPALCSAGGRQLWQPQQSFTPTVTAQMLKTKEASRNSDKSSSRMVPLQDLPVMVQFDQSRQKLKDLYCYIITLLWMAIQPQKEYFLLLPRAISTDFQRRQYYIFYQGFSTCTDYDTVYFQHTNDDHSGNHQ